LTENALFRLDGRVAIVTGAQGRLGPIWIEAMLGAGATVLGIDLPGPRSERFEALRERYGTDRLADCRADIGDRPALVAARAEWIERLGVPHVLVNNAGIDQPPSATAKNHALEDIPPEIFGRILDVNVLGTFQVTQVFGAEMARAGRGSIINLGSLYASVAPDAHFYDHIPSDPPFLKPPAYGASKAAVVNLTRYFATAWGPRGVRVNALSPGGVLGGQDPEFIRKFSARVPLGRMAEEGDLVGPLLFLATDASRYVTGIDLRVEGGFTAW
jgi:NAD(P)-dependent dehydrogenase (short-subunit alcohol dehydrogenase family)